MPSTSETLKAFYDALLERYGSQSWWPGETPFEVMVGAVLTQNTNWKNVEKAIANLKSKCLLDPFAIARLPRETLAEVIRPAGYYNVKAARLLNLVGVLVDGYDGDLEAFFSGSLDSLRERLVSIKGIGLETADSIILYAAGRPTFVIDTYTFRVTVRHGLIFPEASYDDLKCLFEDNLPSDADLFNEYHALLVQVGKTHCRKRPKCNGCPLERFPHEVETEGGF